MSVFAVDGDTAHEERRPSEERRREESGEKRSGERRGERDVDWTFETRVQDRSVIAVRMVLYAAVCLLRVDVTRRESDDGWASSVSRTAEAGSLVDINSFEGVVSVKHCLLIHIRC